MKLLGKKKIVYPPYDKWAAKQAKKSKAFREASKEQKMEIGKIVYSPDYESEEKCPDCKDSIPTGFGMCRKHAKEFRDKYGPKRV
jgi:hypothetical protein